MAVQAAVSGKVRNCCPSLPLSPSSRPIGVCKRLSLLCLTFVTVLACKWESCGFADKHTYVWQAGTSGCSMLCSRQIVATGPPPIQSVFFLRNMGGGWRLVIIIKLFLALMMWMDLSTSSGTMEIDRVSSARVWWHCSKQRIQLQAEMGCI